VPAALGRPTRVSLDPPFLGGDPLEIDARRAAFRDLTVATDRLDLLAAVLDTTRRRHTDALRVLGRDGRVRRVVYAGTGADLARRFLVVNAAAQTEVIQDASLLGVARLFGPAR
jgi:hypothetical protein